MNPLDVVGGLRKNEAGGEVRGCMCGSEVVPLSPKKGTLKPRSEPLQGESLDGRWWGVLKMKQKADWLPKGA